MKPGYKQTEVGVIPEEWELTQLGTLVEYTKGFAFKSGEYSSQGVRVVRVSDTSYDSILEENAVFVSSSKAHQCAKWRLQKDDLVISTVGSKPPMYDSMVGKVLLVPVEHEGALLNQNAVLIRDKKRRTHFQQILVSHLRTKRYLTWIESIYRGNANQASITLKELFAFPVCYPTGDAEQRDIAAALSDLDALHGALDRLIAKKRDLKQAAMQQLLTGQTRLPGFHDEWVVKQLRESARFCSGSYLAKDAYRYGEFEVQGAGSPMGNHDAANFREAISVIGRVGTVGRPRFMPNGCWVNNNAAAIVALPGTAAPRFVHLLLMTMDWSKATSVTAQPFLVIESLMKMEFQLPPVPEQTAIAAVLTDMDAELAALEQRRAKTRALKQGMMQELLTGRTRLVTN